MSDIELNMPHTAKGPAAPETKSCPYCAETILAKARKCKHCGEMLDSGLKREREKTSWRSADEGEDDAQDSLEADKTEYEAHPAMFSNHPVGFVCALLFALVGVGLVILLVWWLKCQGTTLTVTRKKTILRKGILSKHINEVYHSDVRQVQVSQTFAQRLFNVGTIGISSAGQSDVEIQVTGIPRPIEVKDIIDRHRER